MKAAAGRAPPKKKQKREWTVAEAKEASRAAVGSVGSGGLVYTVSARHRRQAWQIVIEALPCCSHLEARVDIGVDEGESSKGAVRVPSQVLETPSAREVGSALEFLETSIGYPPGLLTISSRHPPDLLQICFRVPRDFLQTFLQRKENKKVTYEPRAAQEQCCDTHNRVMRSLASLAQDNITIAAKYFNTLQRPQERLPRN